MTDKKLYLENEDYLKIWVSGLVRFILLLFANLNSTKISHVRELGFGWEESGMTAGSSQGHSVGGQMNGRAARCALLAGAECRSCWRAGGGGGGVLHPGEHGAGGGGERSGV